MGINMTCRVGSSLDDGQRRTMKSEFNLFEQNVIITVEERARGEDCVVAGVILDSDEVSKLRNWLSFVIGVMGGSDE